MPFQSEAQRRFMYSQHPDIAKRWTAEGGTPKNLPERKCGNCGKCDDCKEDRESKSHERREKIRENLKGAK